MLGRVIEMVKGRAPNDTAYKRWSCHSGLKLLCKLCRTSPPPAMGARFTVFFLACRPCGPAGWLALLLTKAGDVETNPGPTTFNKKVWICDICHKQIHVRKQISIRCNRIEHWVHLRCAGIRQAQYTILPTYTTHTTATKSQTHVQHSPCPQRIGKAQTLFSHPLTPLSTHTARAKHIHMSHTPLTPLTSTSPVLDKIPEPRVPLIHALTATTPHPYPTPTLPSPSHPHTLTAHTHATQTTVHASQSPQQPQAQHRVLRQPHKQTKDHHRTTNTTQTHRPSSKSERNLIILLVNINGLRNKLEELKLLIHDTHADIITIQETKLTHKAKTPKIHNFTSVRTDRLHKAGGGLITLIRDNIISTTTDIPSTINTHNIELQMVMVHINNTKHITIANIYIPPRDTTSTHYKTADTDIQHCIQYITNKPQSVLTGDERTLHSLALVH